MLNPKVLMISANCKYDFMQEVCNPDSIQYPGRLKLLFSRKMSITLLFIQVNTMKIIESNQNRAFSTFLRIKLSKKASWSNWPSPHPPVGLGLKRIPIFITGSKVTLTISSEATGVLSSFCSWGSVLITVYLEKIEN